MSRRSGTTESRCSLLFCLTLLVASAPPAAAQTHLGVAEAPAFGQWAEAVDRARDIMTAHMDSVGIPGATIAVEVGGHIVWEEGFGWADMENKVPATPLSRFRIASISKALTSAALMKLVQAGRVDLDAPVQTYVPNFPKKPEGTVTARLLAGHLAGIRHYNGMEFASSKHYDDVLDALEIFENDPLLTPPGEKYSYSTYGWNLISAVVQEAAGVPFLTFMRQEVFDPLGLREIVAEHADSLIMGRGRQYQRTDDGRLINAPYVDNSNKWAGGGYLSTATGLARYGSAYLQPDFFLNPESVQLMWTSQKTTAGVETGYGIGWFTRTRDGRREVWHTGGAVGGSTMLLILPDDGVVVSILTNLENAGPAGPAQVIAGLFAAAR